MAATNFKQRVRKMLEYYHADRLNYLTTGTPNRLEYDQGFFVKLGDGAADIKLIAHLYKSQVYQAVAELIGLSEEQVERVYKDIDVKRRSTLYLHSNPHLVAAIPEIRGI